MPEIGLGDPVHESAVEALVTVRVDRTIRNVPIVARKPPREAKVTLP
jgi:hypothetical protein